MRFINYFLIVDLHRSGRGSTLFIQFDGFLIQVALLANMAHSLFGGKLLALLLGISEARAKLQSLDAYTATEGGAVGTYGVLIHKFKYDIELRLLAPLDELTLEIVILLGHLININMLTYEPILEEPIAPRIATVEIDSTNECLEGISRDETVVRAVDVGRLNELYQSCLLGNTVESTALYHLAAYRSEKSLFLARVFVI